MWIEATPTASRGMWVYADYATAIAAGDSWTNGDFIVTQDGLTLRYFTAVIDGAGLIPAYPLGAAGGLVTAVTRVTGYTGGTDPRTSESWTDSSAGVESTDYTITTGSGTTTYAQVTGTGAAVVASDDLLTASDTAMLLLVESLSATFTGTPDAEGTLSLRRYVDGSNLGYNNLTIRTATSATKWSFKTGEVSYDETSVSFATSQTVWVGTNGSIIQVLGSSEVTPTAPANEFASAIDPTTVPAAFVRAGLPPNANAITVITGDVGAYRLTLAT